MDWRSNALFVVGVAIVLSLVGIGYMVILGWEEPPPAPEPLPLVEAALTGARVERTDGSVQFRVGKGEWQLAQIGVELAPGADVRTGADGAAFLSYGPGIAAEVKGDSVIRVDRLDEEVARFVVGEGVVVIDVDENLKEGDRVVQLGADGSDAVVETRGGRVGVLSDGKGHIQTAVTRGEAVLEAGGKRVELKAGQQSTVAPGGTPSAPVAVPKSLLLKVKFPADTKTAKRRHLIQGTASPGSLVRIGERVVTADEMGRFSAVVDLGEGRNRIVVQAVDVLGRAAAQRSPEITLDTRAPSHTVETDPDMWQDGK